MPISLYFICGTPTTAWCVKQCHVRTQDPNQWTPSRWSGTANLTAVPLGRPLVFFLLREIINLHFLYVVFACSIFKNHWVGQREHISGPLLACRPHTYKLYIHPGDEERVVWWLVILMDVGQNQLFAHWVLCLTHGRAVCFTTVYSILLQQPPRCADSLPALLFLFPHVFSD